LGQSIKFTLVIDDKGSLTLKKVKGSADRLGKQVKKTDKKVKSFSTSLSQMTKVTTGLLGPISAAIGIGGLVGLSSSLLKTGAHFEQTMATVKGVSRATQKEFESLTNIAKKMGEQTEWSATQSGEALQFLSMAGFKAKDSVAALPGVLDLATAGGLDLGRAADIASNALTAMQMPVSDLSKINDTFIATITRSNVNMEMMAESFKYAAPKAKAYGYEIENLSAMIGILGNAGIQGSMAGTQLAFAMGKVTKVFTELGMSGSGKDLIDALEAVNKAGWDTDKVMQIFGERGGRAVLVMKEMIPQYRELAESIRGSEGAAKRLADQMRGTTLGAFKELMSVIESVKIDAFEQETGELNQAIKELTGVVRDNREEWIELGGVLVSITTGFLKVGAATGSFFGGLIKKDIDDFRALGIFSSKVLGDMGATKDNLKAAYQLVENLEVMSPEKAFVTTKFTGLTTQLEKINKQLDVVESRESTFFDRFFTKEITNQQEKLKKQQTEINEKLAKYREQLWDIADAELELRLQREKDNANLERINKMTKATKELGSIITKNLNLRSKLLDLQEKAGAGTKEQERIKNLEDEFKVEYDIVQNQIERIKNKKELTDLDDKKIKILSERLKLLQDVKDEEIKLIQVKIDRKAAQEQKKIDEERKKALQEEKKLAADLANAYKDIYSDLKISSDKYYSYQGKLLKEQYKKYKEFVTDKNLLDIWYQNEKKKLLKEEIKDSDDFFAGMAVGFDDILQDQITWGEAGYEIVKQLSASSSDAMGEFFDFTKDGFGDVDSFLKKVGKDMVSTWSNILARMVSEWAMSGIANLAVNVGFSGFGGPGFDGMGIWEAPARGGGFGIPSFGGGGLLNKPIFGGPVGGGQAILDPNTGQVIGYTPGGGMTIGEGLGWAGTAYNVYSGVSGVFSGNEQEQWAGGGQLVGTGIGYYFGGPIGGAIGGEIGKFAGSFLGDLFGAGEGAGMGAVAEISTPVWGQLPGLEVEEFVQAPGAGSMVPAETLNTIGDIIDLQYQAVFDSVDKLISVLGEQQKAGIEGALEGIEIPMKWEGLTSVTPGQTVTTYDQDKVNAWLNAIIDPNISAEEKTRAWEEAFTPSVESVQGTSQIWVTRENVSAFEESIAKIPEEIMEIVLPILLEETGKATLEEFNYYLAQIEAASQASALTIRDAFIGTVETGDWAGFEKKLKDSIFNSVSEGMITAVMQSEIISKALAPVYMEINQAFEDLAVGGTMTAFQETTSLQFAAINETITQLKPLFDVISDSLGILRTDLYGVVQPESSEDYYQILPPRASGGPVYSGKDYLIGEEGPEILRMGNQSGIVIPNDQINQTNSGGQEIIVHNHLYINGEEIGNVVARELEYNTELIEAGRRIFS